MTKTAPAALRSIAAASFLAALALPAHAGVWTYALPTGSLISGGSLAGSFSGTDGDGNGVLSLGELVSFDVSYTGVADVTTSFTIIQTPDAFGFDLNDDQLVFSVTDADSNAVSVNTYDGGSYSVLSATGPDAGTGALPISAVPEPAQWALLVAGWVALFGFRAARAFRW